MGAFFHELFQFGVYKRTQGRITRQVTFATLAVGFLIATYRLYVMLKVYSPSWVYYGAPVLLLAFGLWASFRIVNLPRFADFLIAVEAEMNKVSWPTFDELWRSVLVVIFVIFALAVLLSTFDIVWQVLFKFFNVLRIGDQ